MTSETLGDAQSLHIYPAHGGEEYWNPSLILRKCDVVSSDLDLMVDTSRSSTAQTRRCVLCVVPSELHVVADGTQLGWLANRSHPSQQPLDHSSCATSRNIADDAVEL